MGEFEQFNEYNRRILSDRVRRAVHRFELLFFRGVMRGDW